MSMVVRAWARQPPRRGAARSQSPSSTRGDRASGDAAGGGGGRSCAPGDAVPAPPRRASAACITAVPGPTSRSARGHLTKKPCSAARPRSARPGPARPSNKWTRSRPDTTKTTFRGSRASAARTPSTSSEGRGVFFVPLAIAYEATAPTAVASGTNVPP